MLCKSLYSLHIISRISKCYKRYSKYLSDDFSLSDDEIISYIKSCIPFIWLVLSLNNEFMGFVLLENFTGNRKKLYSAELTTCFERKAWGNYTKYCAKIFLKKAFDEFGLYKIKALVYPQNYRVKTLLKSSGFKYETTLKSETLKDGKPQDIDIYAIYRSYYYKNN